MARRQYHENSLTDHYESAALFIGSNIHNRIEDFHISLNNDRISILLKFSKRHKIHNSITEIHCANDER